MAVGRRDVSGGITLRTRVFEAEPRVLERCSGYDPSDGSLKPDKLTARESNTALTGTMVEQTPFAFLEDGTLKFICRDADTKTRELTAGTWASAGSVLDILVEATPCRVGRQIVFPTDGDGAKLMVYEPGSSSTKQRPLSMKSGDDYMDGHNPTVTASADASVMLFDCEDANVWATTDTHTPKWWDVDNSGTDVAVFTMTSSTTAGTQLFTKSLGATGIGLTGKAYLVLDVMLQDDEQVYTGSGLFVNDPMMYPSGYEFALYSDTACTTEIARVRIPRMSPLGKVHRIAFRLEDLTSTAKGVAILTASFFTAPASGETYSLSVYSEDFENDWTHKSNFLMPPVAWRHSPIVDEFEQLNPYEDSEAVLPPANNLVADASFEVGDASWTYTNCQRMARAARSGAVGVNMDRDNESIQQVITTGIVGGQTYAFEVHHKGPSTSGIVVTLTPDAGSAVTYPSSGRLSGNAAWQKHQTTITLDAGATQVTVLISFKPTAGTADLYIDDVGFSLVDQTGAGSAWVLQRFTTTGTEFDPETALVRYSYSFCGRNLLGTEKYKLMISNPSDASAPDTTADPWRTYTVAVTLPTGVISTVASAPTAGGSGYAVNDRLEVTTGGQDGTVRVLTVDAGVVTAVSLAAGGTGYTTGSGKATTALTGSGTGCTVNITAITAQEPIDEYGSYLTHALIYRQIYDGATQSWSIWKFVQAVAITASMTWEDIGNDADPTLDERDIPAEQQLTNDYASSARYTMYSGNRVYAGCLDWDQDTEKWLRPTAIEISSYEAPWAFPTTTDEDSLMTDGTELDGYATTGSEVRGLIAPGGEPYVFLDNEFGWLRGDNPLQGWEFIHLGSVGLRSNRTLVDCRRMLIWHAGDHFYRYVPLGGPAEPISRDIIDSSLIDWDQPHNAVYCEDRYVLFCTYNSLHALLIYEVATNGWRIRYEDDALDMVGICTDGSDVFGLTSGGDAVHLFETTGAEYGASSTVREVFTQYHVIAPPECDLQVSNAVFIVETDQAGGIDIALTFRTHGTDATSVDKTLTVNSSKTRYEVNLNLICDAIKIEATYTGTTPPDIYYMGVPPDQVVAI